MASLHYQLASYYLSSHLPTIVFVSDSATVQLSLTARTYDTYRTKYYDHALLDVTLYTYNGYAYLYDLRSLVEQFCISHGADYIGILYSLDGGDEKELCNVFFCSLAEHQDVHPEDIADFIDAHFLTTLPVRRVPRSATTLLWFGFTDEGGDPTTATAQCTIRLADGSTEVQEVDVPFGEYNYLDASPAKLATALDDAGLLPEGATLLAAHIECEGRHATIYIEDDYRTLLPLAFRNAFNVWETVYLPAVTTAKTEVEQSIATCHGIRTQYDRTPAQSYEVETASLTREEAIWLQQLITSPEIYLLTDPYYLPHGIESLPRILITEHTSEIHDDDANTNAIKFTYQFANSTLPYPFISSSRIHQSTFGHAYN